VKKRSYFMTMIDGVFCVRRACDKHTVSHVSIVTLDWSEIMCGYNTPVTVVRDTRTKYIMK